MWKDITWPKHQLLTFTGRNGTGYCTGIELMLFESSEMPRVMIAPITSRGAAGRCDIDIPIAKLPSLIRELTNVYNRAVRDKNGGNYPTLLTTNNEQ